MRASFIVALSLSAIASVSAKALLPRDYPTCAAPCLASADLEGCDPQDFKCLCTNQVFLDTTSQCLYNSCSNPKDLQQAIDTANAACKAAGVTITSTYTPTQSRSQTASETTSTGSNTASVTHSASTTASVSGASGSSTTAAPSSSTGTGTPSGTSSAPASTSNAASARLGSSGASFAMVGAAILGAFAL